MVPGVLLPQEICAYNGSRTGRGEVIHLVTPDEPGVRVERPAEVSRMKRIRIEKPKPRKASEFPAPLPLDPRDPDVVRVKRGQPWRYADRRWAV
jgi:hypothetical protein